MVSLTKLGSRISALVPAQVHTPWKRSLLSPKRIEGRAGVERRHRIRLRDLFTCQCCGCVAADIEVDHKVPISEGGSEDDSNLQSLCHDCHAAKTRAEAAQRMRGT